jgi:NADH-quinone oxidoreductase subunit J
MTVIQLIFIIVAAVTLGAALLVVTTRNLIHAALWLILSLFGVSIVYVLLNAGFFAVVQVVVYIGAIAILFIFAVMLTRPSIRDSGPQSNRNWWIGALLAIVLFGGIMVIFYSWDGFTTDLPKMDPDYDPLVELGKAMVSPDGYVLAFELASILLVAAMIGAIYVAWERRS